MRSIFISYRREDAEGQAGRLFDDLSAHFGRDAVFMDVAGIRKGLDFRRIIDEHVASCGVLLVIVGKRWLSATDSKGKRRLDDPNDFVRLETAAALSRDIPVVPVLVQDAVMPTEQELPDPLKELAFRNGTELTHARWDSDVKLLIEDLKPFLEGPAPDSVATPPARDLASVAAARVTTPESDRPARRSLWAVGAAAVVAGAVTILGYHFWQHRPAEPVPPFANAQAPQPAGSQHGPDTAAGPLTVAAKPAPKPADAQPSEPDPGAEQAKAEQAKAAQAMAEQAKIVKAAAAKAAAARKEADDKRRREDAERAAQLAEEQRKRDEERMALEQSEKKRIAAEQAEKQRLAAEQAEKQRIAAEQAAGAKIFAEFATAVIGSRQNNRR
ncbi:MAG TPA: TIR domain-containing protein [Burkholderiaceae bacterium]|nr:TIR domain-containing protein [Burkholderiaceae bacterium]